MMHYSVAQRTKEIGIRMAVGARQANVVRMILWEGLLLVGAGVGIGLAAWQRRKAAAYIEEHPESARTAR